MFLFIHKFLNKKNIRNNMIKKLKIILVCLLVMFVFSSCSSSNLGLVDAKSFEDVTLLSEDFLFKVARGEVEGAFLVHKFGRNENVKTNIVPVSIGGNYRTPTTAIQLKVNSSSSLDTAAGVGARTLKIIGLNSTGDEISEELTLNGTSDSALSTKSYIRLYRAYVLDSGSYANQTTPSQRGRLTIRDANGLHWTAINLADTNFGVSQTQIGIYSIPRGFTCYLLSKEMSVDTNKAAVIYFFQRQNITDTTAPYSAMRLVEQHDGVSGHIDVNPKNIITSFPELTDVGFMAETTTGTASVSVDFELVCLKDSIFKT